MKRISLYIKLPFAATILLMSCNKLTENPSGVIVASQFYKTSSDAVTAVTAAYNTLNSDPAGDFPMYGRQLNLLTDNNSDNQNFSPSNTNPDVRALGTATYVSANSRIQKNWQQHYYGISKANVAIDNIANIPVGQFSDTTLKPRLIREAKFIRGLLYFNLVRLFGGVPLVLHDATTTGVNDLVHASRASKDEVYAQIITDLTDATNLPATYSAANTGRATSGAAHALLAKVYVARKDWPNALKELQKVLNAGTFPGATGTYNYGLFSNYKDAFQKATKNGVEHIFSAQFATGLGAANTTQYLSSSFTSFNTGVFPIDCISDSSVVKIFEDADTRKGVSFYTTVYNSSTGANVVFNNAYTPYLNKFVDYSLTPLAPQNPSGVNFPVIRYADILLLYAEVLNEINGGPTADAYTAINLVRTRAYAGVPHDVTPGLNQSDFRDTLFLERRKEFVQEGQRWFDLVRRGVNTQTGQPYLVDALKVIAAKKAGIEAKDTLYPIPLVEIQTNPNLKQNPGWEGN
ncbi:RagB/SusD family nutrient uptake outer membrane protein [Pinibacter aurantiacus]|uniref:RagB/SusD family nutrient uptake outer membrane protein n=1 Tax=Pinibacter aurantiacus TaxID=2851599 RepID=A0A9E2SF79_9BACT|nr:RagB/SusD family nutrient uptake outer membrane protein [Pinibacter aurantiacus]MBV4360577.1 RagB/SusD family nutrient uptake outer membrane protein [Pinibacter aurantiacus]